MKHVMLDIETLGNESNSIILSIGACYFDPDTGVIGDKLSIHVDAKSCEEAGMKANADTALWWMGQDEDARKSIITNQRNAIRIEGALSELSGFIKPNSQVWGNGSTFDNAIVKSAYSKFKLTEPWKFWNDRDVRTIVEIGRDVHFNPKSDMPFEGIRHDALDDAIHQAKYVMAIWDRLTSKPESQLNKMFDAFNAQYGIETQPLNHNIDGMIKIVGGEYKEWREEITGTVKLIPSQKDFVKEGLDVIYAMTQQLRERGVDIDAGLAEVHRSNMSKTVDFHDLKDELNEARKRYPDAVPIPLDNGRYVMKSPSQGKVIKPACYSSAVITEAIIKQK